MRSRGGVRQFARAGGTSRLPSIPPQRVEQLVELVGDGLDAGVGGGEDELAERLAALSIPPVERAGARATGNTAGDRAERDPLDCQSIRYAIRLSVPSTFSIIEMAG